MARAARAPGVEASPEVIAVFGRGLGLPAVTMGRAFLAGHVSSGFDSMLLVRGGDDGSLADFGEVSDASGCTTEQRLDAESGAGTSNTVAAVLGGFAAVAALNTLVMTVLGRGRALGALRLVGATRRQVLLMLGWEGLLVLRDRSAPRLRDCSGHADTDDARHDRRGAVRASRW